MSEEKWCETAKWLALILFALFCHFAGGLIGYSIGRDHAVTDCKIWAVECYDPDNPEATQYIDDSIGKKFDMKIYIELDGEVYIHGCDID